MHSSRYAKFFIIASLIASTNSYCGDLITQEAYHTQLQRYYQHFAQKPSAPEAEPEYQHYSHNQQGSWGQTSTPLYQPPLPPSPSYTYPTYPSQESPFPLHLTSQSAPHAQSMELMTLGKLSPSQIDTLSRDDLLKYICLLEAENAKKFAKVIELAEKSEQAFLLAKSALEKDGIKLEKIDHKSDSIPDYVVKILQGYVPKYPILDKPLWAIEKLIQASTAISAAYLVYSSSSMFIALLPVMYAPSPALPFVLALTTGGIIYGLSRNS